MQNPWKVPEPFLRKHAITLVMWGLTFAIGTLLFSDFSKSSAIIRTEKIDPYVLSTKGETLVIRDKEDSSGKQFIKVAENKKEAIFTGDRVKTIDSTATIHWPDGSITRLGEKSSIRINEMRAETANRNIQVDFSLESGKSWSNVIKYMFGESYFHERFNDDTALAAVRGTVFEVNLDRNYVHTVDHSVSIRQKTGTWDTIVANGSVIDTKTGRSIARDIIDIDWNRLNHDADIIYLNNKLETLRKNILASAGGADYMKRFLEQIGLRETDNGVRALLDGNEADWERFSSAMKSKQDPQELMDIYQQFYGLGNADGVLDTKIKLRDLIIETAPEKEKRGFLDDFARSTLYDLWNISGSGGKDIAPLKGKLEKYLQQWADKTMLDTLQNAASQGNIENVDSLLEDAKTSIMQAVGEKNLMEEVVKEIDTESLQELNDTATDIRNSVTDGLKDIINK